MPRSSQARADRRMSTLASVLLSGAALLPLMSASADAQSDAGNYYFFGDSATGQGNWSAIVGEQGEDHYPYSSNNGFARESNGLIWAEMLGRDVDIILDPDADSDNLNFAISGAHMTRNGDLAPFGIETGVLTQTELFGNLAAAGAISVGNSDIAFMLAGGNDFLDRLEEDDPADVIMADFASAAATNVRALADAGVKTIILSEMQPIQYAPQYADAPEVQSALADLVDEANAAMLTAVDAEGLPADVNIVTMKYGEMVAYMVENGEALGFTDVTGSCVDPDTDALCSTDLADQNEYLFFDDLHFTERAHQLQAQWWLATLAGSDGSAARQTARLPRAVYEQLESHRGFIRPGAHTDADDTFGAWLSVVSSSVDLEADGADPSARLSLDGAVLGMERRFSQHFVVGGGLSVSDTTVKFADGGRHRLEGGALSLYGALDYQELGRLSLALTRGGHEINEITRLTGVDFLSANGETDTRYWDVELAARSIDQLGPIEIDHGLALSAGRVNVDGYDETGADGLALSFGDQSFNYRRVSLDAIARGPSIRLTQNIQFNPLVDGVYTHQFGDDDYSLTSELIGNTAQPATIRSAAPAANRFDAGVGAELAIGERWALTARYARQWANDIDTADEGAITLRATF